MPLETHEFNFESVYDDSGVDYLYSRVSFAGRSVVNGLAAVREASGLDIVNGPQMNYKFKSQEANLTVGGFVPRANPTTTPPPNVPNSFGMQARNNSTYREIVLNPPGNETQQTHESVRFRLQVPRGKLYLFWGFGMETKNPPVGSLEPPSQVGRLFLESPGPSQQVDAKNGPIPRLFNVVEAFGDAQTLIVDWGVETYVNEALNNEVRSLSALLSNRFSQTHSVDSSGYTTMTTTGTAIFRTDDLWKRDSEGTGQFLTPDAFRGNVFMPVPLGFTREILYVTGRADVTGVDYSYRDTQVPVNFVAGPFAKAASISCVHRQAITTRNDLYLGALSAYERVLGIKANKNIGKTDEGDSRDAEKRLRRLLSQAVSRGVRSAMRKVSPPTGTTP